MKICITVGHSLLRGGAITSASGYVNEYQYNKKLGESLKSILLKESQEVDLIICPENVFTSAKQEPLYKIPLVNSKNYDLLIELHLNASDGNGYGTEVLYHTLGNALVYATRVVNKLGTVFRSRGAKKRDDLYILNQTEPVAILIESFFCDNKSDYEIANKLGYEKIATLIAEGILNKEIKETPHEDLKGHWAEPTVRKFIEKGYINGYPDGTFKPDNNITRAEFVTLTNKVFAYVIEKEEQFKDVNPGDWFYKEIRKAVAQGYINGYEDSTFRPNNSISREEAAVVITNIKGQKDSNIDKLLKYKDEKEVSTWARISVETVIEGGYMKGYEDNTFRPLNKMTRAEAVVILDRLI